VALFYYLMVARQMYIAPPERQGRVPVPASLALALWICALGVVLIGVYPKPLVMATLRIASALF
jgi:NADH:ubiquinone oxidoreductase subunit 2 (subunit N)